MPGSLNRVMLIGNLGKDPDMRYLPNGDAVTTFPVTTSRQWTGPDGQKHEVTDWHSVVVYRKLAEQCTKALSMGRTVYVEGSVKTRSWDDAASGQKKYRTEVVGYIVEMLDQRPGGEPAGHHGADDDDLDSEDLGGTPF
jgi:single-strand DNA-binding protein